jgi:RNA polymerase sigma-70 factor (ECF subfamily)
MTDRRLPLAAVLSALCGLPFAAAAPVPKPDPKEVDKLLERVRVDNLGSSITQQAIAKDLAMDEKQAEAVAAVWDEVGDQLKAKVQAVKPAGNPGGGAEAMLSMFGAMMECGREFDAGVLKVLKPDQIRRLKQIQLQKEGPAALLGRHALRALDPTAEQEDKMAAELAKLKRLPMSDEIIAMASGAAGPNEAQEAAQLTRLLDKYAGEVDAVQEAMLKHLTADQRAKWKQMTGDPLPRLDLLRAGTAFGDARAVKVVTEADAAAQPVPPQVVPAGGPVPVAQPPAAPPPPPPVEKK